MTTLDEIIAATESRVVSDSTKPKENGVKVSENKDENGSDFTVVTSKRKIETEETVVETNFDTESKSSSDDKIDTDHFRIVAHNKTSLCINWNDAETAVNDSLDKDENHEFRVGDLVWGKLKGHPWMPGLIYDPKDASDLALKNRLEGFPVAFFGDGSSGWCLPSKLAPFVEKFAEMSKGNTSNNFVIAVQSAVEEISRAAKLELTCNCVAKDDRREFSNIGVKMGVLMPELDVNRHSISIYEPDQLLDRVKRFATADFGGSEIEAGVLKGSLSAYYCYKGWYDLTVYKEPCIIEGLEDKNETVTLTENGFAVGLRGPQDGDKTRHRTKRKSIAKLYLVEERADAKKQLKGKKIEDSLVGKKKRKIENVLNEENGGSDSVENGNLAITPIEKTLSDETEGKEVSEELAFSRERKKSKYLSPPYVNQTNRFGSFKIESWMKPDKMTSVALVGKQGTKVNGGTIDSSFVSESDEDASEETVPYYVENDEKIVSESDVNASVDKVLSEVQFAAVDPLYLQNEGSLDMVQGFVSAFRRSTYSRGSNSNGKVHDGKGKKDRKRKSQADVVTAVKKVKLDNSKPVDASENSGGENGGKKREGKSLVPRTDVSSGKTEFSYQEDELMSGFQGVKRKFDITAAILENYHPKFSAEDKSTLKDAMKHLMEEVEEVSEMVRVMAEKAASKQG